MEFDIPPSIHHSQSYSCIRNFIWDYWVSGLRPSSSTPNRTFQIVNLLPSSGGKVKRRSVESVRSKSLDNLSRLIANI